jgi:hypothetical protein
MRGRAGGNGQRDNKIKINETSERIIKEEEDCLNVFRVKSS